MADTPESIGKYKISRLIARGGMGAVYKAVHPTLNRPVILKKLTVRNAQFIERFKREAKIMMDFKHDNIVTVYDHFKEGNSYYIVLEYVDGFSLDELIKRERALPSALAMNVFLEICRALKYAHDSGVIHRDIKPANVLISRTGEVKLVDFGIAAYEEGEEDGDALTTHGMTLGTPSYMPPEQFENTRGVDKCADIYAMGVVLYEMVTGKKPFPGNFAPDTINSIQKGRYVRVRRVNPRVDKTISRLIGKMIQPRKERRFQDLAPVIRILERRLKREDVYQEDERLLAMMNKKQFVAKKRPGKALKRFLSAAIVILVIAAVPVGALLLTGVYHEWIDPADWGKLSVSLELPASVEDELPVSIQLYSDKGGEIKRVTALPFPGVLTAVYDRAAELVPRIKGLAPGKAKPAPKPAHLGLGLPRAPRRPARAGKEARARPLLPPRRAHPQGGDLQLHDQRRAHQARHHAEVQDTHPGALGKLRPLLRLPRLGARLGQGFPHPRDLSRLPEEGLRAPRGARPDRGGRPGVARSGNGQDHVQVIAVERRFHGERTTRGAVRIRGPETQAALGPARRAARPRPPSGLLLR